MSSSTGIVKAGSGGTNKSKKSKKLVAHERASETSARVSTSSPLGSAIVRTDLISLPAEILSRITRHLVKRDKRSLLLTCKRFNFVRDTLYHHVYAISDEDVIACYKPKNRNLVQSLTFPVTRFGGKFTMLLVAEFLELSSLNLINFTGHGVIPSTFTDALKTLPNLTHLVLRGYSTLESNEFSLAADLPNLRSLALDKWSDMKSMFKNSPMLTKIMIPLHVGAVDALSACADTLYQIILTTGSVDLANLHMITNLLKARQFAQLRLLRLERLGLFTNSESAPPEFITAVNQFIASLHFQSIKNLHITETEFRAFADDPTRLPPSLKFLTLGQSFPNMKFNTCADIGLLDQVLPSPSSLESLTLFGWFDGHNCEKLVEWPETKLAVRAPGYFGLLRIVNSHKVCCTALCRTGVQTSEASYLSREIKVIRGEQAENKPNFCIELFTIEEPKSPGFW